jgi:hypothetical protein
VTAALSSTAGLSFRESDRSALSGNAAPACRTVRSLVMRMAWIGQRRLQHGCHAKLWPSSCSQTRKFECDVGSLDILGQSDDRADKSFMSRRRLVTMVIDTAGDQEGLTHH